MLNRRPAALRPAQSSPSAGLQDQAVVGAALPDPACRVQARSPRFSRLVVAAWVAFWAASWLSEPMAVRAQVVHEFVPDVDPGEALRTLQQRGGESDAIVYDGQLLSAPDLNAAPSAPPMQARPAGSGGGGAGGRPPEFRPDRLTQLDQGLDYYAAFNPTVAPFKRVTSLDAIRLGKDGTTPILTVSTTARTPVPVGLGDRQDTRRDRFWGQVDVDFSEGAVVAMPSVSPEARILSLRAEPAIAVQVQRDVAGNFHVMAVDGPTPGVVRLSFLTDAAADYFGMPIPAQPVNVAAAQVPDLPASVRRRGLAFAQELGLSTDSDLRTALHRLVEHFRGFRQSEEAPRGEDIFLALARAQKGLCRHRAYAFVITAQALGVPARFVQNEAHSWVEVIVADQGPMRIDLGGAPSGLTAHGTEDRPRYRPRRPDSLPRPQAYEAAYAEANRTGDPTSGGPSGAVGADQAGAWLPTSEEATASPGVGATEGAGGGQRDVPASTASTAPADRRMPLAIRLDRRSLSARRGRAVEVSGRVRRLDGAVPPALRIEVSLAAPDRDERMLLGVTATDAAGRFAGRFAVPADLSAGDYDLVVLTPGDAEHQSAVAN